MGRIPNTEETEALEGLIDKCTLFEVLAALSVICGDKAGHLRENWQDKVTAATWDRASKKLGSLAQHSTIANL